MASMEVGLVGGTKGWKGDRDSHGGVQDVSGVAERVGVGVRRIYSFDTLLNQFSH